MREKNPAFYFLFISFLKQIFILGLLHQVICFIYLPDKMICLLSMTCFRTSIGSGNCVTLVFEHLNVCCILKKKKKNAI
jgi:hypothetical protein